MVRRPWRAWWNYAGASAASYQRTGRLWALRGVPSGCALPARRAMEPAAVSRNRPVQGNAVRARKRLGIFEYRVHAARGGAGARHRSGLWADPFRSHHQAATTAANIGSAGTRRSVLCVPGYGPEVDAEGRVVDVRGVYHPGW